MTSRPRKARASGGRTAAAARRDAVREILARGGIGSQEDLQRALQARGIAAAQATLSRDLAILGVTRTTAPGGPQYHVPGDTGALPIEPVRGLVDAVLNNGSLVVVRTKAGAASTIARALDDARLRDTLGTLAGDDTIFVVPARDGGAPALARRLRKLFGG